MVNCAVSTCKRRSATSNLRNQGVSYHIFPKDPYTKEKWRIFCGHTDTWRPTRTSVVCSKHFTSDCFDVLPNNRRKLVDGAVPTLKIACTEEPPTKLRKKSTNIITANTISTTTQSLQTQNQLVFQSLQQDNASIPQPSTTHSESNPQSLQSQNQSYLQPCDDHSQFIPQPSKTCSQSNLDPSTAATTSGQLETPRQRKLVMQLNLKNKKIHRLQAKIRYLKKKVNTLQELLDNLEEK